MATPLERSSAGSSATYWPASSPSSSGSDSSEHEYEYESLRASFDGTNAQRRRGRRVRDWLSNIAEESSDVPQQSPPGNPILPVNNSLPPEANTGIGRLGDNDHHGLGEIVGERPSATTPIVHDAGGGNLPNLDGTLETGPSSSRLRLWSRKFRERAMSYVPSTWDGSRRMKRSDNRAATTIQQIGGDASANANASEDHNSQHGNEDANASEEHNPQQVLEDASAGCGNSIS